MLHPRYVTSSTNVRSFEDTLNVVTAGSFSESEDECNGRAVPGPARSEAKLVVETYGGPDGGNGDVRAWYSR
jgi:hypothetical protein